MQVIRSNNFFCTNLTFSHSETPVEQAHRAGVPSVGGLAHWGRWYKQSSVLTNRKLRSPQSSRLRSTLDNDCRSRQTGLQTVTAYQGLSACWRADWLLSNQRPSLLKNPLDILSVSRWIGRVHSTSKDRDSSAAGGES